MDIYIVVTEAGGYVITFDTQAAAEWFIAETHQVGYTIKVDRVLQIGM